MFDFSVESLNEMRDARRRSERRRKQPRPVRVKLRPTFLTPPPVADGSTLSLNARLAEALPTAGGTLAQVSVSGSRATVSGTVGSDYDRQLAEKMLMLQPGIYEVDNKLTLDRPAEQLPLTAPQ